MIRLTFMTVFYLAFYLSTIYATEVNLFLLLFSTDLELLQFLL